MCFAFLIKVLSRFDLTLQILGLHKKQMPIPLLARSKKHAGILSYNSEP